MSFIDGVESRYADATVFTDDRLYNITSTHVANWLLLEAYGTATPGPDDHPTLKRLSCFFRLVPEIPEIPEILVKRKFRTFRRNFRN